MNLNALLVAAGCLLAATTGQAHAQTYPTKPIRLVNPYGAGGPVDTIAREVSAALSTELGQQVIVDVKSGGGTVIGANVVSKAPADRYTLLLGTQAPLIVQPAINSQLPYDAVKDFAPVAMFVTVPGIISVPADSPLKSLKDLVDIGKREPGKINYASAGNGTGSHLGGELFNQLTGAKLAHVPYRGAAPGTIALLANEVQVGFVNITPQLAHLEAGRLRALAVTGSSRSSALPNVPTAAEAGVPGLVAESWYGLFAPAGTPPAVLAKLAGAMQKVMAQPALKTKLAEQGAEITYMGTDAFSNYLNDDRKRLLPLIKSIGLKQG
jgi:tripartite-type tricarboxylate transporter receptor subunit TctC